MKQELIRLHEAVESTKIKSFITEQLSILESYGVNPIEFRLNFLNEAKKKGYNRDMTVKRFANVIEKKIIFESMKLPTIFNEINAERQLFEKDLVVNYKLTQLRTCYENRTMDAFSLASRFINEMKVFENYDVIQRNVQRLQNIFESYETDIRVYQLMNYTNNQKLLTSLTPILENYFYNLKNDIQPSNLLVQLESFRFDPHVNNLYEYFDSKTTNAIKIENIGDSKFDINSVYSILWEAAKKIGERYIQVGGDIYKVFENNINKINRNHQIPSDFVIMNNLLEQRCDVSNGTITYNIHNSKPVTIGMDGSNKPYMILEKEEITDKFEDTLRRYQNLDENEYRNINILKKLYENIDKLVEIDNAKVIQSKVNPAIFATIFKIDENNYSVRINNPFKNIDIFTKNLELLQLSKLLKETLDFEIKNKEIGRLIQADLSKIGVMEQRILKFYDKIDVLKNEVRKIDALEENVRESKEISQMKLVLETQIRGLEKERKLLKEALQDEMLTQDLNTDISDILDGSVEVSPEYLEKLEQIELGDVVIVDGKSARILNINDATGQVSVFLANNMVKDVSVEEIDIETKREEMDDMDVEEDLPIDEKLSRKRR